MQEMSIKNAIASCTLNRFEEEMVFLKSAASESRRKLAASQQSFCHLTAHGKQDRSRLLEVTNDNYRLQTLNGISKYTCIKLRRERNKAELELREL